MPQSSAVASGDRQKPGHLFATASAARGGSETAPPAIGPEIVALCKVLKTNTASYVPVQKDPNGLYGFCNVGVLEKISVDGGAIRFGWIIWEYPGVGAESSPAPPLGFLSRKLFEQVVSGQPPRYAGWPSLLLTPNRFKDATPTVARALF
jgi:hypothetical protein